MLRKNSTAPSIQCKAPRKFSTSGHHTTRSSALVGSHIAELEKRMRDATANLEFEEAARIRDEIRRLKAQELELPGSAASANVGVYLGRMQNSRVRTGSSGRPTRRSGR
jgi:excinuclease ABC subunit B